ncbi:MAG: cyclic nucleotide-binding domain-containing protein [Dehalococcoidia bacterium]|nr:MAG: cyclic nucleotide-binding domain-containing protein [Dehalococcoidia bacterium]
MVTIDDLKKFRVFMGLGDTELASIVELCSERTFGKGAVCFGQGQQAMELHLCRTGKVDIVVELEQPSGKVEETVHTSVEGEIFGWSAVVEPHVYTASARCAEKTEDICIKGTDLLKLFEQNTGIGYVVMRNLSSAMSSRLTDIRQKLSMVMAETRSNI